MNNIIESNWVDSFTADLAQIICQAIVNADPELIIEPEVSLEDYGLDSVGAFEVSMALKDAYDIQYSADLLFEHETLAAMTEYILTQYSTKLQQDYAEK